MGAQREYVIECRPGETEEECEKRKKRIKAQRRTDLSPLNAHGLGGGSGNRPRKEYICVDDQVCVDDSSCYVDPNAPTP